MRLVVLLMPAAMLVACHGSYRDLESSFRTPRAASAPVAPIDQVVLTSTTRTGAQSFHKVLSVRILPATIELEPSFPNSLGMEPIAIPADKIAGCSMTCFGGGTWDADLLIATAGTQISLRGAKQVVEWCWSNQIPMISAKDKRSWMYSGGTIAERGAFAQQLSSRKLYDEQAKQSCMGY